MDVHINDMGLVTQGQDYVGEAPKELSAHPARTNLSSFLCG